MDDAETTLADSAIHVKPIRLLYMVVVKGPRFTAIMKNDKNDS